MDSWGFSEVGHYERDEDRIDLEFNLEGGLYYLILKRNSLGEFFPFSLFHNSGDLCTHCHKRDIFMRCHALYLHRNAIFHQLIQNPSIRLEWLYLPYEGKDE